MKITAIIIIVVYAISLLFIFAYSLTQLSLVISYLKSKTRKKKESHHDAAEQGDFFPVVTVQLPVYNEKYVVERLLDAVAEFDYPADKLEVQVLDDSTDETAAIISSKVTELRSRGVDIKHICRNSREGFKAGALAHGLQLAKGNLIAIFDADFIPNADFLKKSVLPFADPKVGLVQTRWQHINKNYSLLTKLQAFGLDAHFYVEQAGRNAAGHFMNFNGTAGIWRKECIEDAGGWQSDTLTEDLDLSYRAQLRDWKFIYLSEVGTPAELPLAMNALKNQQFRWNKGAAECAKKNLPAVWKKPGLGIPAKIHAAFHLMNSTVFLFIMLSAVLSVPMLFIKQEFMELKNVLLYGSFFLISMLIFATLYFTAFAQEEQKFPKNAGRFLLIFPLFLSVSMGLALYNAAAVLQGYFGKKTPFHRTPKFGLQSQQGDWKENAYLDKKVHWMTLGEGLLAVYFLSGIVIAFLLGDYALLPFHLMLSFGFAFVCYYSVAHSRPNSSGFTNSMNDFSSPSLNTQRL